MLFKKKNKPQEFEDSMTELLARLLDPKWPVKAREALLMGTMVGLSESMGERFAVVAFCSILDELAPSQGASPALGTVVREWVKGLSLEGETIGGLGSLDEHLKRAGFLA